MCSVASAPLAPTFWSLSPPLLVCLSNIDIITESPFQNIAPLLSRNCLLIPSLYFVLVCSHQFAHINFFFFFSLVSTPPNIFFNQPFLPWCQPDMVREGWQERLLPEIHISSVVRSAPEEHLNTQSPSGISYGWAMPLALPPPLFTTSGKKLPSKEPCVAPAFRE